MGAESEYHSGSYKDESTTNGINFKHVSLLDNGRSLGASLSYMKNKTDSGSGTDKSTTSYFELDFYPSIYTSVSAGYWKLDSEHAPDFESYNVAATHYFHNLISAGFRIEWNDPNNPDTLKNRSMLLSVGHLF